MEGLWGAGFAESALASYIIALGRKASSAAGLARQLETQARNFSILSYPSLREVALTPRCLQGRLG